jgi:hypothetical protein
MAAPTDVKGTPLSAMLDAKNTRMRAEADMKLLQNRLSHLKIAEERARKKIAETKARTQEIVGLKKRNMNHQESKTAMAKEREVNVAATAKNVAQNRKSLAKHVQYSRSEVDRRRKKDAETTRERFSAGAPSFRARARGTFFLLFYRLRELGDAHDKNTSKVVAANRRKNEAARRERDEARRRKEQQRLEVERKRQEERVSPRALRRPRAPRPRASP